MSVLGLFRTFWGRYDYTSTTPSSAAYNDNYDIPYENLDYRGHMATMSGYETSAELFGGIC